MKLSLKPGCCLAYSEAICSIVVITPPSAGRERSQEISRGLMSPPGFTADGLEPLGPAAEHAARARPTAMAVVAAVTRARVFLMRFHLL
jgi:hypothetical protein